MEHNLAGTSCNDEEKRAEMQCLFWLALVGRSDVPAELLSAQHMQQAATAFAGRTCMQGEQTLFAAGPGLYAKKHHLRNVSNFKLV